MPATDAQEFERLMRTHRSQIARVCRSILRDDHLGADAAQETFLRLWNRMREQRGPHDCVRWLRRVAINTSLNFVERSCTLAVEEVPEPRSSERRLSAFELRDALDRALEDLPRGQRTVFLLSHEGGLTLREIADSLNLQLPTVKTQFARACMKLQRHLRPFQPNSES